MVGTIVQILATDGMAVSLSVPHHVYPCHTMYNRLIYPATGGLDKGISRARSARREIETSGFVPILG